MWTTSSAHIEPNNGRKCKGGRQCAHHHPPLPCHFHTGESLLLTLLSLLVLEIAAEVTTDDKEPLIIRVSSIMTRIHTHNVSLTWWALGVRYPTMFVDTFDCSACLSRSFAMLSGASVQKLSLLKTTIEDQESPIMRQIFEFLFPFGPAWNASTFLSRFPLRLGMTALGVQF